ncbi:hypothetical protein K503DRAFT_263018 [Rhizopogon vinicolor AM-OR11-026]|uniref:Uncharacterized protein n=1 Tax=Rhizopogon vinicolor AM-OR11-026 TaxID=1314800 RepID=A0A1B7NDD7_9AGAM|nr:hypothetical protein K503DRAFT_263018 [Rhizopogon vinicolor AM-OR11-026]
MKLSVSMLSLLSAEGRYPWFNAQLGVMGTVATYKLETVTPQSVDMLRGATSVLRLTSFVMSIPEGVSPANRSNRFEGCVLAGSDFPSLSRTMFWWTRIPSIVLMYKASLEGSIGPLWKPVWPIHNVHIFLLPITLPTALEPY